MTTITATLPATRHDNGKNFDKPMTAAYNLVGVNPRTGEIDDLASLRIYQSARSGASTVYAGLWLHGGSVYAGGHGSAGGGGYCKQSGAAEGAFAKAGVKLSHPIHGRGTRMIEDALAGVGRAMGYAVVKVVTA